MKNYFSTIFLILLFLKGSGAWGQNYMIGPHVTDALNQQRFYLVQNNQTLAHFNIGFLMSLGKRNTGEFRFFASLGLTRGLKDKDWNNAPVLISYQLNLEGYRGGVGTSLLDEERAGFQWEIRNMGAITAGFLASNPVKGRPLVRMVGASESSIRDPYDYSIGLATVFVNGINHQRNQQLGIITVGALEFSASYGNDGPFLSALGMGDSYDRYWTGCGHAGFYFLNDYGLVTSISLQYMRYTGWQPNLYELGNMLGLDYLSYKDRKQQFFNQGVWNWELGIRNTYAINFKYYEAKRTDVQDMIHLNANYTFHPNPLGRRMSIGMNYKAFGYLNF